MDKKYDIILFGVTGFTGKLAAEYLYEKSYGIAWAVSARNPAKAEGVLKEIAAKNKADPVPILQADLVCTTPEQEATLKDIVTQTKVVLTCSGPFEKYGQTLVKLCAENGVHYADITGETDFVRTNIQSHSKAAQESGAAILSHCGNDCIPQDLTVLEMHNYAVGKGMELVQANTYVEVPESASLSGGTIATATFQLTKDRKNAAKPAFDPLLTTPTGEKSESQTKSISPKGAVDVPELDFKAEPWIMGPVMVNCVRRSNVLLGYSKDFKYGDAMVASPTWEGWAKGKLSAGLIAGAIFLPSIFQRFVPKPGEGPTREDMENGYMTLYGVATMKPKDGDDTATKTTKIKTKFHFNKDIGYLYTAALLVETGMTLLAKSSSLSGGVSTPAAALGDDLMQRILQELDASWELEEIKQEAEATPAAGDEKEGEATK
mmetsp:Transcript_11871/g.34271  ORF Transcript_11871/g.34271 Transcript_11871/m.34271 type:complete len:433 (-) Transcript_11871:154-1452(-)|eukprot:CAMPEP_0119546134 /NCGR_PEP_ID=MMETSP1352-20130426/675_1 /TAXON_ID=265584 /ORGANISM="Stauroneis constricta, Strain CCMP1120" /LENGTH=432 /DNA_ID=CAMNT_0007590799 /DNA_START=73 /DNA_END=1371 /DNA_ORIENTATION=-